MGWNPGETLEQAHARADRDASKRAVERDDSKVLTPEEFGMRGDQMRAEWKAWGEAEQERNRRRHEALTNRQPKIQAAVDNSLDSMNLPAKCDEALFSHMKTYISREMDICFLARDITIDSLDFMGRGGPSSDLTEDEERDYWKRELWQDHVQMKISFECTPKWTYEDEEIVDALIAFRKSGSLRDFLYARIAKESYLKDAPVIDNLDKTNELLRQSFAIFAPVKTIDDTIRDTMSIIQSLGPTVTNVMLWFDMGKNCIPRAES